MVLCGAVPYVEGRGGERGGWAEPSFIPSEKEPLLRS